jgi:PAS domain S-box-containing protein
METEFRRLVDALPGLVWAAEPDGRVDLLNHRWREFTGLSADAARGDGWQVAIHPDDRLELAGFWRSLLASGKPGETEGRLRRADGAYRWFQFRASPLLDASGRIIGWCGLNTDIDDRKRAEAALRVEENRFGLIVDGLPALVTIRSPTGELVRINRHAAEYFGASLTEMQAWGQFGAFHPEDRDEVLAAWTQAIATGRPFDTLGRERRADGVYRWLQVRGHPLRDADERIILWYLLHTDVDEQKRSEALLVGEKRLLEMIASGCELSRVLDELCLVFALIADGLNCSVLLVDVSRSHLRDGIPPGLSAKPAEDVDRGPIDIAHGPCAAATALNEQVISSDVASEDRWSESGWPDIALAHGLRSVWSTPVTARTGEVIGCFAVHSGQPAIPTPVHQTMILRFTHLASIAIERARSDDALRRSEALLAEAQRLSATGSFRWRPTTGEISWSDQTYRIFGFDLGGPVTLDRIASRVHPDDLPALADMVERGRSGRDFEYEHRLLMPDKSIRYLHMVGHGISDGSGEVEYAGAVRDITDTRLSDQALSRVRSELARMARVSSFGALTASIAHEVNQPLAGIVTNASTCLRMLAADPPNIDGALETARRTIRDGNRAADVITRLRALFIKRDAPPEPIDLNDAAREVLALSAGDLQRNGVILKTRFAKDLPHVVGDRVQLQQVILNLLLNAADAMAEIEAWPRHLLISTEHSRDGAVRLAVEDRGTGFDPVDANRLFEAFHTTKSGGMGIGLSISRSIVESHQGEIWAVANDGPGATFFVSIPVATEPGAGGECARKTLVVQNDAHFSRTP